MVTENVSFPFTGEVFTNIYGGDDANQRLYDRYVKRPEHWRDMIMFLGLAGDVPLAALTSQMASEKVTDNIFHWETDHLPDQRASITNIYSDAGLNTLLTAAASEDDVVYVEINNTPTAGNSPLEHFRVGHQVLIRDTGDPDFDITGKVVDVGTVANGAFIAVKLLEADDNGTNNLSNVVSNSTAVILITGNINAEGGLRPSPVNYRTQTFQNFCQIFRTPLEITGSMLEIALRNENSYQRQKKNKFRLNMLEIEKAFLWGIQSTKKGDGKTERTTQGLVSFIRENAATNVASFNTDSSVAGKSWKEEGPDWLDDQLRNIYKYTPGDLPNGKRRRKIAFCGAGALLGIQRAIKAGAHYNITADTSKYGLNVRTWIHPLGEMELFLHPLFNQEETNNNTMLIFEPDMLVYNFLRDTKFKPDPLKDKGGSTGYDGLQEEWLTEAGLEVHHPLTMGYLNGIGIDSGVGVGAGGV